jgi:hypothetical protein
MAIRDKAVFANDAAMVENLGDTQGGVQVYHLYQGR